MKNRKAKELFGHIAKMKCMNAKGYIVVAVGALTLMSCGTEINESDYKFGEDSGAKVTFSAVIDEQQGSGLPTTRVTETNWEVGDCVGITCGSKQLNVQYKYSGDAGNFFYAVNGTKEIWLMGTEEYQVSAYSPYRGEDGVPEAAFTVETTTENQATEEQRKELDFLYASGTANRENPNVQLAFSHVMSRIVLKFVAGADLDKLSDIDCYITGLRLRGSFNPNTGETVVNIDDKPENKIGSVNQVLTDENNHTMTAFFLPQSVEKGLLIEAGMNGIYYQVNVDIPSLQPGYSYTYTVTANDYNDNPIKLTITGTEITPWTNVDGGSFQPDPSLAGTEADITPDTWGNITEEKVTPTDAE